MLFPLFLAIAVILLTVLVPCLAHARTRDRIRDRVHLTAYRRRMAPWDALGTLVDPNLRKSYRRLDPDRVWIPAAAAIIHAYRQTHDPRIVERLIQAIRTSGEGHYDAYGALTEIVPLLTREDEPALHRHDAYELLVMSPCPAIGSVWTFRTRLLEFVEATGDPEALPRIEILRSVSRPEKEAACVRRCHASILRRLGHKPMLTARAVVSMRLLPAPPPKERTEDAEGILLPRE